MEKMKPWSDIQVKDLGLDVKHMNTEDPSVVNATGFPKNAHISRFNTAEPGSGESVTIGRRRSAETLRSGFASTPFQNRIENRLEKEYTGASRNLTQSLAASQSLEDRSFRKEDTLEYILTDRSGIAQVNPTRSSGGLRSQQDYEMHYADDSLGGDVTYDELLYYLLQVMYLQRLMEQMKRIEANPDMPYLANAFAEDEGLSAQGEGYAYMDMQDSMKGHGMEGQMTQLEDDGAITYKELFLSTMEVAYFIDVKIKQYPGKHASLYVKAVLDSDMDENDFHGISDNVSLQYWKDEEAHVLFYGVIDDLFLDRDGEGKILVLTAWDATMQMDIQRKKRIFQNPEMGVHQLVSEVMKTYIGSDYKIHVPDVPIGQLVVQYEETDWEFLKRFLSKYNEMLYSDTTFPDIRFEAGLSPHPEAYCWDALPFVLSQDLDKFVELKVNGMDQLTGSQNTMFEVASYDVVTIGSQVIYKGSPWFVESTERIMENGLLKSVYRLRQREGLKVLPYFNQNITGVSIDGTISGVQRDRVQVEMEIEAGDGGSERYWFPFSTVAASSDGSGWYCMPEAGESVRVYFPTDDEKEAYVVTAIKSHEPDAGNPNDPMGNPNVRNIETAQGNQVQFTEEGVVIAAGEGKGSILIKKSGEIVLDALLDIRISAVENLNIAAMNELTIKSQDSIRIASSAGGDVEIQKGTVTLHGKLINEN